MYARPTEFVCVSDEDEILPFLYGDNRLRHMATANAEALSKSCRERPIGVSTEWTGESSLTISRVTLGYMIGRELSGVGNWSGTF